MATSRIEALTRQQEELTHQEAEAAQGGLDAVTAQQPEPDKKVAKIDGSGY
jgi:hypothetical protein